LYDFFVKITHYFNKVGFVDRVATLVAHFKALTESKDQKALKIATITCLSLIALKQTENLGNSLLLIAI